MLISLTTLLATLSSIFRSVSDDADLAHHKIIAVLVAAEQSIAAVRAGSQDFEPTD